MFHGFYTLTSGMISQSRNLNVISNNMTNIATPGFKQDTYISGAFQQELLYRYQNREPTLIGDTYMRRGSILTSVDYTQGGFVETENPMDFALTKPGFFQVQTEEGETLYTRMGAFYLDDDRYLTVSGVGRVLGTDGAPIQLTTDDFNMQPDGTLTDQQGNAMGTIGVVDFNDYQQLVKEDSNMFSSAEAGNPVDGGIRWKAQEASNVNGLEQMTAMISSQRALQSAAQVLKIYDNIQQKAGTEIGKI